MNTYDVGQAVELVATFKVRDQITGVLTLTDPTTVTYFVEEPNGARATKNYGVDTEVERDSEGVYRLTWTITQEGVHTWRAEGTGDCQAARERQFSVRDSRFYPA